MVTHSCLRFRTRHHLKDMCFCCPILPSSFLQCNTTSTAGTTEDVPVSTRVQAPAFRFIFVRLSFGSKKQTSLVVCPCDSFCMPRKVASGFVLSSTAVLIRRLSLSTRYCRIRLRALQDPMPTVRQVSLPLPQPSCLWLITADMGKLCAWGVCKPAGRD